MAQRRRHSKISKLPQEAVDQVNSLLTKPGTTYQDVVDFLAEQGILVSHSSVGRYGKDFLSRLERLQIVKDQARAIVSGAGDRPATEMHEAANQLAIQMIMEHLLEVGSLEGESTVDLLKALARLERSSTGREKLKLDYRKRAKEVATSVDATLKEKGLSPKTLQEIKEKIYGIVG